MLVSQASPVWNYDNLPYRPDNNLKYECNASVISPPPSPVNNFTVVSYELQQSRIILDLEWYPPAFPIGNLAPYDICVGREPLGPNEEVGQNTGHFCAELSVSSHNIISYRKISAINWGLLWCTCRCNKNYHITLQKPFSLCQIITYTSK